MAGLISIDPIDAILKKRCDLYVNIIIIIIIVKDNPIFSKKNWVLKPEKSMSNEFCKFCYIEYTL